MRRGPIKGVRPPNTQHFEKGKIGSPSVAASPGTPDANALSEWGQIHIVTPRRLHVVHIHGIEDKGSGSMTVEIYRRRSGALTMLCSVSIAGGAGDYHLAYGVPSDPILRKDDYMYCQLTAFSGLGGYDGLTVDLHYAPFG